MADVITRFKLETTQYDSKLRDASKGLVNISHQAEMAGKEFAKYTQNSVEAARALGNISTSATNAKDKVKELVDAYNQVARAYNALTEEQRKSDFGKAMSASLEQLQGRIREAKSEMNSTGGVLSQLKDKFTINIDAMKLFNVGLSAAKTALDVAKDAFFASEATVDEWGRTMDSSKSLYEGFLTAINTGDISGYLSRIDDIVNAARAAYNELDRLGTMKTIQAPAVSAQQTENDRLRMMIQTRRYIAPMDGRRASMQNGQLLSDAQIKNIERQLQGGMQKLTGLIGNEVKQTNRAINAVYQRQGAELGLSVKEFRKGTSSMAEFDKRMAGFDQYQRWREQHTTIDLQTGRETVSRGNPYAEYAKWGAFRVDGDRYNELVQLIQQRDQQMASAYGMQSQAYRTINRAEGITARIGGGGAGGGRGASTTSTLSLEETIRQAFEKAMAKASASADSLKAADTIGPSTAYSAYMQSMAQDMEQPLSPLQKLNEELKEMRENLEKSPDTQSYLQGLSLIAEKEKEIAQFTGKTINDGTKTAKSWTEAARAVGMVGNALSSLQDPSAQIASTVAMAIANIAMAYSETLAKDKTNKSNIWYFIATAAAAMVSMATTISSIHSATGYAKGGIVDGNSYSGDNIPIMANAGELILDKAAQNSIASQLEGNGMGNLNLRGVLSGENIVIAADRYLKRSGQGELAVWK